MDYLILALFFAGVFIVFSWGLQRDVWKIGKGRSCCSAPFDREQALKEEREARKRKRGSCASIKTQ